jgi:hypothetical protein
VNAERKVPRLSWRLRSVAREDARNLALSIVTGRPAPVAHYDIGVILEPGEVPWQRARARLSVWTTQSCYVQHTRAGCWGYSARSSGREVTTANWRDVGVIDWLITSKRLVGRLPGDARMESIWWGGLVGAQVDLDTERVLLDSHNGWRGRLTGPGVAPIAVAAVAICQGQRAMLEHPGLGRLRDRTDLRPSHDGITRRALAVPRQEMDA